MAKRATQTSVIPRYKCKDCKYSCNWHEKNWQGNYLCAVAPTITMVST